MRRSRWRNGVNKATESSLNLTRKDKFIWKTITVEVAPSDLVRRTPCERADLDLLLFI